MWSPTDGNLLYLCLGATSLFFVLRHVNSKILKRDFQSLTVYSQILAFFIAAFIVCYLELLKSETHLRDAQAY